ncbi:MAG: aminotransferase class III-fold pyridoxal phosphate-dependent enzyme [Cyclobacteriaceae bacterium]|nr:aminotransferase class III-fold pyridoxal phosphate-dependent enzyme [Cyclobacteriaceae bacterium]
MIHKILAPYHLKHTDVTRMEGYDSLNYKVTTEHGNCYVLKHYVTPQAYELVNAETEVLNTLKGRLKINVSRPQTTEKGYIHVYEDKTFSRLLTYIPGIFLAEAEHNSSLIVDFGHQAARLDLALKGQQKSAIQARQSIWDIQHCLLNSPKAKYIEDVQHRKLVDYFFGMFRQFVLPALPALRSQLIHADLNDWNVLVKNDKIEGFIDFGDMAWSPLINEVAIALTYLMFNKENPIDTATAFISGYTQELPLTGQEVDLLYYLIPARLGISVCNSAEAKAKGGDTDYILISEAPAWALLKKWFTINPVSFSNSMRKAAGLPAKDYKEKRKTLLKKREKHLSKALSLSFSSPIYMKSAAFQYMYGYDGNTYLDAYNNIPHVGHSHPQISEAITRQAHQLYTNTRYLYDSLINYSEKLLTYFPEKLNKVFYVNSGSAATDLAIRLANTYTGRHHVLIHEHSYHGHTNTGINISAYKFDGKGGQGLPKGVTKLPLPKIYNGIFENGTQYAREAIKTVDTLLAAGTVPSAFIAEPISGCGGQVPLAPGYLEILKKQLDKSGIVTIMDEVQTGFGRSGDFFWAWENYSIIPDIVVLGKPMGNGHPIGAVVTTSEIALAFENGMEFFSSFGGNPVSAEVALAVLNVIEEENLQNNARETGSYFKAELKKLEHPEIGDIRGPGLFLGVELVNPDTGMPATELAAFTKNQLKKNNILTGTDGPFDNVLKIKPPLCFTKGNVDTYITALDQAIKTGKAAKI